MATPICGHTTRPMNTSPQFALREGKPSSLVLEKNLSHQREADGSMEERCECSRNGLFLQLQVSPGRLKGQGWTIHEVCFMLPNRPSCSGVGLSSQNFSLAT